MGRRVKEESLTVPILFDPPQVSRLSPQYVLGVNENRTGRAKSRVIRIQSEPLQVHHPQTLHHFPGSGTLIKIKTRPLGSRDFPQHPLQLIIGSLLSPRFKAVAEAEEE